ncbi:MAG: S-methyl-5'-thioadenosine phosphorylase [Candidatus Nealsonbacteria bacterium]|nr:S-methyl-5'-thioadenosine phosphorylase [Candidatus Nealsonbacteria bacterium]
MPENYLKSNPKIAIIGGSGLEDPKFFKKIKEVNIKTPFGYPSSPITIADFHGKKVAFLSRHGKKHQFPPHKVPQRANIWALKKLGVERIIGVGAVGSLKREFKPGDIVTSDQFIDFTKKRDYTFYDKETVHITSADPFCPELARLLYQAGKKLNISIHQNGTYICIEGPRFSTKAESKFFRNFADIVGMTLIPEVNLARELEICYSSLASVTDWDVWKTGREVSWERILNTMKTNMVKLREILKQSILKIPSQRVCPCRNILKDAK